MKPALRPLLALILLAPTATAPAAEPDVEALIYSTMPSTWAHRPEMALDGDPSTFFRSAYGMSEGDDFHILLSRPIPIRSLRVSTGDAQGQDALAEGVVEVSSDGASYRVAATFDKSGVASANLLNTPVSRVRVRLKPGRGAPALLIREVSIGSATPISHAQRGPGRAFSDLSQAPDVAAWARRAEKQMEQFWPDTAALLYSPGFIPPNKVNIVYKTGPGVTGVAAVGGGVMTVNSAWCRKNPDDTGLTVHEVAHVVQSSSSYDPGWLVEGIADYVRWVKFEPQNHKPRLDPAKASYRDSYRTTATFLGWCEIRYDSALVTKLNHAIRFGRYKPAMWKQLTGHDVDALWAEFLADYRKDPTALLAAPVAPADRPRELPLVKANSSVSVDVSKYFNAIGIARDNARFSATDGFDGGGASYSAALLGTSLTWNGVRFNLGAPDGPNLLAARGNVLALPEQKFASLWILGAAVEGSQMAQDFVVTYADGTTQAMSQNWSDWFTPRRFPGESRALAMAYRNLAAGARDARPFNAYAYGFALEAGKVVRLLSLPDNANLKILAVTLAN